MREIRHLAREIVAGEAQLARMREERGADRGQLHAFGRALHELRLGRFLETAQAHAQCRLTESQGFRRSSEMAVLRDDCEIVDVPQIHSINRIDGDGILTQLRESNAALTIRRTCHEPDDGEKPCAGSNTLERCR